MAKAAELAHPALFWNSATIYFLLTDRFENGDPSNDLALGRKQDGAVLRSYMGGDLKGVLNRLEDGYFDSLGVDAIWMTPFQEQNLMYVDAQFGVWLYHDHCARYVTGVAPVVELHYSTTMNDTDSPTDRCRMMSAVAAISSTSEPRASKRRRTSSRRGRRPSSARSRIVRRSSGTASPSPCRRPRAHTSSPHCAESRPGG